MTVVLHFDFSIKCYISRYRVKFSTNQIIHKFTTSTYMTPLQQVLRGALHKPQLSVSQGQIYCTRLVVLQLRRKVAPQNQCRRNSGVNPNLLRGRGLSGGKLTKTQSHFMQRTYQCIETYTNNTVKRYSRGLAPVFLLGAIAPLGSSPLPRDRRHSDERRLFGPSLDLDARVWFNHVTVVTSSNTVN